MIELPEFMTATVIERTYRRMVELQDKAKSPFWAGGLRARGLRDKGVRMAMARHPQMLLFLERSAEYLKKRNDEQMSHFEQLGYRRPSEYSECALFRTAYEKMDDPKKDEAFLHATLGWVYAAVAEALDA
jgi:hypothetical protein